jgi:2-C-methyl-D-erythritol 4-phosphate cytidylyltransferase
VSVAAIVTAAGRGQRMGAGAPKGLRTLAGRPLVAHAVVAMAAGVDVSTVIVVAPADSLDEVRTLLATDADVLAMDVAVTVVAGGSSRQQSVSFGVNALPDDADVVLVHDAARPLVPVVVVDAVINAVRSGADAAIPVLPVSDTIRSVDADEGLTGLVDRDTLRSVQTPQGFTRTVIEQAHAAFADDAADEAQAATDDASLVERLGVTVVAVPGSPEAFKVTRALDLVLAEAVLARRRSDPTQEWPR